MYLKININVISAQKAQLTPKGRAISTLSIIEILSKTEQLYEKHHLKKLAISD